MFCVGVKWCLLVFLRGGFKKDGAEDVKVVDWVDDKVFDVGCQFDLPRSWTAATTITHRGTILSFERTTVGCDFAVGSYNDRGRAKDVN